LSTTAKLCDGLAKVLDGYAKASDPRQRQYHALWRATSEATPLKPIRGEVIVNRTAAAWESQQVQEPCILPNPKDPTRLVMFYSGVPATNRNLCFIGKAWALKSAPFTWHQDAHNPVFSPAKQGWDSGSIRLDAVLHVPEEDAYYIYYSGTTASVQDRIGLAVWPGRNRRLLRHHPAAIRRVAGNRSFARARRAVFRGHGLASGRVAGVGYEGAPLGLVHVLLLPRQGRHPPGLRWRRPLTGRPGRVTTTSRIPAAWARSSVHARRLLRMASGFQDRRHLCALDRGRHRGGKRWRPSSP